MKRTLRCSAEELRFTTTGVLRLRNRYYGACTICKCGIRLTFKKGNLKLPPGNFKMSFRKPLNDLCFDIEDETSQYFNQMKAHLYSDSIKG